MVTGLCNYFHTISVLQLISQWNNTSINLGADALIADIGMNAVGEINGRSSLGKRFNIAVRRKNVNLFRK